MKSASTLLLLAALLGCAHTPTARTDTSLAENPMQPPTDFPADENGNVLRLMVAHGDDLSRARIVDFGHLLPDEASARRMAAAAEQLGFAVQFEPLEDDEGPVAGQRSGEWDVTCSREMVPTHAGITATERQLDALARSFGGRADGWGCETFD